MVNDSVVDALTRTARHEALLLDPVYSGKAMAGLIDLIGRGYFEGSRGVVFVHTGGTPAIFAYEDVPLKHIQ